MDRRDLVAFAVFCGDWGADMDERSSQSIPHCLERFRLVYKPQLEAEHSGDCMSFPWTCTRCVVEEWYAMADAILAATEARMEVER